MLRSLLVPAILAGVIATPFLMPLGGNSRVSPTLQLPNSPTAPNNYGYSQPVPASTVQQPSPFRQASQQRVIQGQPILNGSATTSPTPPISGSTSVPNGIPPTSGYADWGGPIYDENNNVIGMVPGNSGVGGVDPALLGYTPDYGAAQTMTFGGNAGGPDFNSELQFTPVTNFAEVFNYGVTSGSMSQRWGRVSNAPAADGMRGKRVALVTGTNSWDLHGALTYYFDEYQKCRRITFRGWAGDPTRLIELLQTQHGFKQQPTHWAGFYLAKSWRKTTGGMLMKSPTVSYADNKVEQIGVLLELNDPSSKSVLSDDFISLIRGSQQSQ